MIDLNDLQIQVFDFLAGNPPEDCVKKDSDRYRRISSSHERMALTNEVSTEQFYRWKSKFLIHQPTSIAFGSRFLVVKDEYPRIFGGPGADQVLEQVILEISRTSEFDDLPFWRSFLTMERNKELVQELEAHREKIGKRGAKSVCKKPNTKATLF